MTRRWWRRSSESAPPTRRPARGVREPHDLGPGEPRAGRFGAAGVPKERVTCVRDTYTFNYRKPPGELVAAFRDYYGPTMNAFEAAEKNGRAADLQKELVALLREPE